MKQPTSRISQFIQQSKELVVFYKNGIKLLWSNHKEAKALQLKVQQEDYELKRSEFQLIHRSKKDMIKLIPFGFVFCILPESVKFFFRKKHNSTIILIAIIDSFDCHLLTWHGS